MTSKTFRAEINGGELTTVIYGSKKYIRDILDKNPHAVVLNIKPVN